MLPGHGFTEEHVALFSACLDNGAISSNTSSALGPPVSIAATNTSSIASSIAAAPPVAASRPITAPRSVTAPRLVTAPRSPAAVRLPAASYLPAGTNLPAVAPLLPTSLRLRVVPQAKAVPWTAEEDRILVTARQQQISYRRIHEVNSPFRCRDVAGVLIHRLTPASAQGTHPATLSKGYRVSLPETFKESKVIWTHNSLGIGSELTAGRVTKSV